MKAPEILIPEVTLVTLSSYQAMQFHVLEKVTFQVSVPNGDGLILFVWLRGRHTAHFLESALGLASPGELAHNLPDPPSSVAHLCCSLHFNYFQSSFALKEHIVKGD